ncbi:MAG: response regulator [Spirochaetales bacterium]|nr:response regulator [Spirochaetales bacterium]
MKKGMIVDDAAVMRMRLRDILSTRFSIVAEAENGKQAIEEYQKYNPDFVTMDISMAEMNGMEALKGLIHDFPDANIVMVSAVGQKALVFEALNNGAKDFIIKPFEAERVLMAIDRLFE